MRFREKEVKQKQIINVGYVLFILIYMLPGLDKRFGWSDTPAAAVLLADLFVLLGYALIGAQAARCGGAGRRAYRALSLRAGPVRGGGRVP